MASSGYPSPYATFLIIGPTCFFLGILFAQFPYDYYVLWASPPTSDITPTDPTGRGTYLTLLETHLKFIHASPPLISRILHIVIGTGIIGLLSKLYKPSEANMLFDGATLVLYMIGIAVYISNIVKGLRVVTAGLYGESGLGPEVDEGLGGEGHLAGGSVVVGRDDTLKVLAASNTILALVLVGVLVLQTGHWYAQKKEAEELEGMDRARDEKRSEREKEAAAQHAGGPAAGGSGGSAKKSKDGKKRQ